jgi:hypothetical protein
LIEDETDYGRFNLVDHKLATAVYLRQVVAEGNTGPARLDVPGRYAVT